MHKEVLIIGAGPAGLTAAYLLSKEKIPVCVLESDPIYVGGIARTINYKGYCFDIGGHRFFSKSAEIEALWQEILPDDMLDRPRQSRIFYRGKFFSYPLQAFEALYKLGLLESIRCVLSYLKARVRPIKKPISFADWITNHFGKHLYSIFFKTYTEKVWGMPCHEISADWAAQRIKGLSLSAAIINALLPQKKSSKKKTIKTLINSFRYPRKGPGMLWEACKDKIIAQGGKVLLGKKVTRCTFNAKENNWQIAYEDASGQITIMTATHVISSAPLREVVEDYLQPPLSTKAIAAAKQLHYRDFLIVVLILQDRNQFSDNWIYIHESKVDVARIQNFKSWSPEMIPEAGMTCYGMEYFCFKDDKLWAAADDELIQKAKNEISALGLANIEDIKDGYIIRQPKAYPVYDAHYQTHVETIREELEKNYPSFYLVGRNGMHKYNNQDHAMMTAMLTVKNILQEERQYDVWCVNQDAEYIESNGDIQSLLASGLRAVPQSLQKRPLETQCEQE